ncbi:hypothetical protein QYE76_035304 [Lolium multiflorum]|uniref:Gag-pol polyprotein n=1 Tax=Lolium multiflorum TaxID=4521 RepID=A0AAD8VNB8_LOLMU|nr:hypothetical protein QYE76_035304 [Lolium multiflorum]
MPVAETLINAAAGHKVLSFMDSNAGYNQIFMAPEDIHKTAFRVPGPVGLFEYVVMTFGLKNAGATYQRAMNYIFHDLIGKLVEIYIDDVVVKSVSMDGHLDDLRRILDRTRKFGLRMNPKKCAFGVTAGQFLGFLVHERGIEIGLKSQEAVRTMQPPTTKKELQRLIGKINFVRRFISNLSGRIEPFMALVKIKSDDEFQWGAEQQQAFDEIKRYLTTPHVLVPPQQDRPFYIYLSVADTSIASVVVQLYEGVEKVVFYLSRRMLDAETRYPEVEKLCLCLFFTCTKLHHILLTAEIIVICKLDVVKHMLSAPILKGRLGKWMFALSEFDLRYQPAKAVKGQALADLIAERINTNIAALSIRAWAMFFDGSACDNGCGIGILLVSPRGATYSFSIRLSTPCTSLCLFFTCTKLHHILLTAEIIVICKSDVVKHMLSAPILKGRLGKWMFALSEFDLRYQPAKAVKGQALADLIAERINTNIAALSIRAWAMFFDGSACDNGCGIGILLVSPRGATYSFSIRLSTPCTNNVAEYEAVRKGMELLLEAGAKRWSFLETRSW